MKTDYCLRRRRSLAQMMMRLENKGNTGVGEGMLECVGTMRRIVVADEGKFHCWRQFLWWSLGWGST